MPKRNFINQNIKIGKNEYRQGKEEYRSIYSQEFIHSIASKIGIIDAEFMNKLEDNILLSAGHYEMMLCQKQESKQRNKIDRTLKDLAKNSAALAQDIQKIDDNYSTAFQLSLGADKMANPNEVDVLKMLAKDSEYNPNIYTHLVSDQNGNSSLPKIVELLSAISLASKEAQKIKIESGLKNKGDCVYQWVRCWYSFWLENNINIPFREGHYNGGVVGYKSLAKDILLEIMNPLDSSVTESMIAKQIKRCSKQFRCL